MTHPYATEAYANSLPHIGTPLAVPEWGCWVLQREIPGGGLDACGPYPLTILQPDADIAAGLHRLRRSGMVTLTVVLDEFHQPAIEQMRRYWDVIRLFKQHHIRYAKLPFAYSKHHRYEVGRAGRRVQAGVLDLASSLTEWRALYATLAGRHDMSAVHRFPATHEQALASIPGVHAFGAWHEGTLVSAHIWVNDGQRAHSHLAASSPRGYELGAAYAVNHAATAHFAGLEAVNFGGSAGADDDPADGLARFKRGFCNGQGQAYLCGAVLDPARYAALAGAREAHANSFFPLYRAPAAAPVAA